MKKIFVYLPILLLSQFVYADQAEVFSFSRSACLFSCPVFELNVFSDDVIVYKGIKNTEKEGVFRLQEEPGLFTEIQKLLDESNFSEFLDRYNIDWLVEGPQDPCETVFFDFPGSLITMQYADSKKTIDYYHGCTGFKREQELKQLEKYFFEIIHKLEYEKAINVFSYSKASCVVGSCPSFEINVFSDGVIVFKKTSSTNKSHQKVFRLPENPHLFVQIEKLLKENKFSRFRDSYGGYIEGKRSYCKEMNQQNQPRSVFSFRYKRSEKTVEYYHSCTGFKREKELIQLEQSLFKILGLENYVDAE